MNYVTAAVMQFTSRNASSVVLKARGKFMNKAIDVSQVVTNRFLKDQAFIDSINVGSEEFQNKEGKTVRVSTIEITLKRK